MAVLTAIAQFFKDGGFVMFFIAAILVLGLDRKSVV